ncbi:SWIRM domain-containing protein [Xylaria cf. heliscus]|nr:SWIRM domain-containing protein [Xylaria cf. heliscus]
MASAAPKISECKKTLDISNLMSPPEPPKFESFAHSNGSNNVNAVSNTSMSIDNIVSDPRRLLASAVVPPLSPPISPATKPDDHVMSGVATSAKDPILYPAHDVTSSPPQHPLFVPDEVPEESTDARQIVDNHISTRPAQAFRCASPPKQEDYELALSFKSQVMKKYEEDRKAWLQRERDQLILDRRAQAQHRQFKLPRILPAAKPQPVRKEAQRVKPARAPKVTKPVVAAKPTPTKPRPIRAGPGPSPVAAGLTKPIARAPSSTPDPTPRRGTAQNRADDDFESIPDLCPPLDSLNSKIGIISSLKVEWKTGTTDLTNDPHRHLLHPEELHLASSLRLTCAVYLTSKRRIFVQRLLCLERGKEFRKTDAQQACKIDVNKASKLWTAFDKIGWLDKAWVSKHLGPSAQ